MSNRRILCVHEGPDMQKLRQALESDGYEVVSAVTGINALDVLSSQPVDGVVLDFDAKGPGGIALRNRIFHQRPDMPMLLFRDIDDLEHMPISVFRAYLQQPEAPDTILAHLKN
ncbi:MAG TPA: response regulator [Terriglobales bacterium]|nr:response regulator [Terriglobales bacterium]